MKNIFIALIAGLPKKVASEMNRHAKRKWKRSGMKASFSAFVLFFTMLFLFLPLIFIVIYSFSESKEGHFGSFSLHWYRELFFNSDDLWLSLANSAVVGVLSALTSTLLGTMAAVGTAWYRFPGKAFIRSLSLFPMILPEVIVGIAMLIFFSAIKFPLGIFSIFVAHTTFCLPFVYLMVCARLEEFDLSIIEASRDLGAGEIRTMMSVVIPSIMPAVVSAFLLALTMSFEDFVITFFVSGPGSTTLPLYVYSMIRFGVSPVINALSFVMILFTAALAFILRKGLKGVAASS